MRLEINNRQLILSIDPLKLPDIYSFNRDIDRTFIGQTAAPLDNIRSWVSNTSKRQGLSLPRHVELEHRLSKIIDARFHGTSGYLEDLNNSTLYEIDFAQEHHLEMRRLLLSNEHGVVEALRLAHACLGDAGHDWRMGDVGTMADACGQRVIYPQAGLIEPSLKELSLYLQKNRARPVCCAIVAYAAITNLHPFTDGNGRVARVIFNILASDPNELNTYLPLRELERTSRSGLMIALRLATYFGEWDWLAEFILRARRILYLETAVS